MAHSAMAKLAALLCIALLLVAHVDGSRMLKQVTADTITAETHTAESEVPAPVAADDSAVPATEYNYATEDPTPTDETAEGEFASGGFLVPPSDSETTPEELPSDEDQGESLAVEESATEGPLWQTEDSTDDSVDATTASEETTTPDDDSSPPAYDFDATTQNAESVYPQEGESLAAAFDSTGEETTEEESPEFAFDDSNPEFHN